MAPWLNWLIARISLCYLQDLHHLPCKYATQNSYPFQAPSYLHITIMFFVKEIWMCFILQLCGCCVEGVWLMLSMVAAPVWWEFTTPLFPSIYVSVISVLEKYLLHFNVLLLSYFMITLLIAFFPLLPNIFTNLIMPALLIACCIYIALSLISNFLCCFCQPLADCQFTFYFSIHSHCYFADFMLFSLSVSILFGGQIKYSGGVGGVSSPVAKQAVTYCEQV